MPSTDDAEWARAARTTEPETPATSTDEEACARVRATPVVTSSACVTFKRSKFTGFAAAVSTAAEVALVVATLQSPQSCVPYAFRLRQRSTCDEPLSPSPTSSEGDLRFAEACAVVPEDESRDEGACDGGDVGVGDKLLHLLRHWDVENVVLAVRRNDSRSIVGGEHLGVRRFKIVIDCAKSVLELCYLDSLRQSLCTPAPPAELELECELDLVKAKAPVPREKPPTVAAGVPRRRSPNDSARSGFSDPSDPSLAGAAAASSAREVVFRPAQTDLAESLGLPEGRRDVDAMGAPRVLPRGRVNNFAGLSGASFARRGQRRETARSKESAVLAGATSGEAGEPPWLSAQHRNDLRCARQPHREVELVLRCVCALLDGGAWLAAAGPRTAQSEHDHAHALLEHDAQGAAPSSGPDELFGDALRDWQDVSRFLSELNVNDRLRRSDPFELPVGAARATLRTLAALGLGPRSHPRLRRKSVVASEFLPWLWSSLVPELGPEVAVQLALLPSPGPSFPKPRRQPAPHQDENESDTWRPAKGDTDANGLATALLAAAGRRLVVPDDPTLVTRAGRRTQASAYGP